MAKGTYSVDKSRLHHSWDRRNRVFTFTATNSVILLKLFIQM